MIPSQDRLFEALDRTWPAAAQFQAGPWLIREGKQGGQRVSAATPTSATAAQEISLAEAKMDALGQERLFQINPDRDGALDQALEAKGYVIRDPVLFYVAALSALGPAKSESVVMVWPPLAKSEEIWADGGIGPGRLRVMERVAGAKTSILARKDDHPAGTAFVAVDNEIAMIHAIEVPRNARRKGAATDMLNAAAGWAKRQGASNLALAVTRRNVAANGLYASLGMTPVGGYHYRAITAD